MGGYFVSASLASKVIRPLRGRSGIGSTLRCRLSGASLICPCFPNQCLTRKKAGEHVDPLAPAAARRYQSSVHQENCGRYTYWGLSRCAYAISALFPLRVTEAVARTNRHAFHHERTHSKVPSVRIQPLAERFVALLTNRSVRRALQTLEPAVGGWSGSDLIESVSPDALLRPSRSPPVSSGGNPWASPIRK